ncbi:hypothetical protein [Niabella soli]|nr:hypothetical protein [Niabella soli]
MIRPKKAAIIANGKMSSMIATKIKAAQMVYKIRNIVVTTSKIMG